mmetsp:Transcript_16450/g.40695  ORF Transcript_16450/g.40695 Transcript_16450/m.40695 type:complete len:246 (-) Transcript_16450:1030-1767(-)|eukprot:CAMPEP_0178985712 /NCGR_PEP_ID=MMETSP0795-20121207/2301_1 /TAXON_ID=88552 /ORGANISM="Amoebophrya sp., Strain Ameob2" /LENGTH=245 /DNA_ID=CAMNT_0020676693 /DNA_START=313 /DNA_END=1050 /DNA_ORIENTATION=+
MASQPQGYTAGQQPAPPVVVVQQRPATRVIVQRPVVVDDKAEFLRVAALVSQITFSFFTSLYIYMLIYGAGRTDEAVKAQLVIAAHDIQLGRDGVFHMSWLVYLSAGYRDLLGTSWTHVILMFTIGIAINIARCTRMFFVSTRKSVGTIVFLSLISVAMLTVLSLASYRVAQVSNAISLHNTSLNGAGKGFQLSMGPTWLIDIWAMLLPLVCVPLLIVGWVKLPDGTQQEKQAQYERTYGSDATV